MIIVPRKKDNESCLDITSSPLYDVKSSANSLSRRFVLLVYVPLPFAPTALQIPLRLLCKGPTWHYTHQPARCACAADEQGLPFFIPTFLSRPHWSVISPLPLPSYSMMTSSCIYSSMGAHVHHVSCHCPLRSHSAKITY